jgi:hypothetical protein
LRARRRAQPRYKNIGWKKWKPDILSAYDVNQDKIKNESIKVHNEMKTLATILWMAVFAVLAAEQGICQQVMEPKPPAEATVTGLIKTITPGSSLVLSVAEESGRIHKMTIILPNETKITMDDSAAKADDLRIGKAVTVTCTTQNAVPGTNNVPAGKTTVRTAKSISIIFGNNSPLADNKPVQQETSARIPGDFIGSWISVVEDKTEKMQITTNHIRWNRNVPDPQEVYDSNSNKLNDKGDVLFDTKVFLTKDVSANATVILKVRDGKLLMKEGPSSVDIDNVKLSNPGEELVYVRDRTPTPPENKPSPAH